MGKNNMGLFEILRNSLALLIQKPKVFFPRILTTILYTVLLLAMTKISVDSVSHMVSDPSVAHQTYVGLISYLLKLFAIATAVYVIDIITYAMYPRIVMDYNKGINISLRSAFGDAMAQWKTLLVFAVLILLLVLGVSLVGGLLHAVAVLSGSLVLDGIVLVLVILSVMAFSVLFFFVVPISVIEKKGIIDSFKRGMSLSMTHRGPVMKITVVFMIISLATMLVAVLGEFKGTIAYTALALFVVGRLLQACVATYISVVSPYFYISVTEH